MTQQITIELTDEGMAHARKFAEDHKMSVNEVVKTALDDWLSDKATQEAYSPFAGGSPAAWKDAR